MQPGAVPVRRESMRGVAFAVCGFVSVGGLVGCGSHAAALAPCAAQSLSASIDHTYDGGVSGSEFRVIAVADLGGACTLNGYPAVTALVQAGSPGAGAALSVVHRDATLVLRDPGPVTVTLRPGGWAYLAMSFGNGQGGTPVCVGLRGLAIAPVAGVPPVVAPTDFDVCYGEIGVTGWISSSQLRDDLALGQP